MKIGIMGGTFDPIHYGHLSIAQAAWESCSLREVWFLPNINPPHKKEETIACSGEDRITMTKMAISHIPYFQLNLHESNGKETSYTCDTLAYFKKHNPNSEFFFIIGADSLFDIEKWKSPEKIFSLCTVLVTCRDEVSSFEKMKPRMDDLERKYGGRIVFVSSKIHPYSSTEIRYKLKMGQNVRGLVPDPVLRYIYERGLYGCETHFHTERT